MHVFWLSNATIYEVNLRQYTSQGNFTAFQAHLPRLKAMGITVLWLMPVQPIGILNRKGTLGSYYSISDYTAVNPEYGSLDDFKNLVKAAHDLGMKIVLDWVANHTSWDHVWMREHPDFYSKNEYGSPYAPYDWSDVVQLDHQNEAQQSAMITAMQYWVKETGIDGFRCDMAHLTPLDFWKKTRQQCDTLKPLFWLAETQDTNYFEAFDVVYGWEWLHKMKDYYEGNTNIDGLDAVITYYLQDYHKNKFRILFTSNHDENSWQGTELQRLGDAAPVFAAISALLPGVPLIYSGQEEPLLRSLHFFDKDNIGLEHYALKKFYKTLLECSQKINECTGGLPEYIRIHTTANDKVFSFLRKQGTYEVLLVANLSNHHKLCFALDDHRLYGLFQEIFSGEQKDFGWDRNQELNAWAFKVYARETSD